MSSGLTTLPRDLLIFSLFDPKIIPWLNNFWNGSFVGTTPISYKNLCQKRAYNKCNTACSAPPIYRSTGNHFFKSFGSANCSSLCGSMKRNYYHELPAHCGIVFV